MKDMIGIKMNLPNLNDTDTYERLALWFQNTYPSDKYPEYACLSFGFILKNPTFEISEHKDIIYTHFKNSPHPLIQLFLLKLQQVGDTELYIKHYKEYLDFLLQKNILGFELDYSDAFCELVNLYIKQENNQEVKDSISQGVKLFQKINCVNQENANIGLGKFLIELNKKYNKDKKEIYSQLIQIIEEIISKNHIKSLNGNIWLYELLISCSHNIKSDQMVKEWQQKLYNYYDSILDQVSYGVKQGYIKEMLKLSTSLKVSEKEKFRLQELAKKVGKEITNTFQEYDILTPEVKDQLNIIVNTYSEIINKNSDFKECLFKVIHYYGIAEFLCKSTDVKDNKIQFSKNTLAYHVIGSKITFSEDGLTTNNVLEFYNCMIMPCKVYILSEVIIMIVNKFKPKIEELEFLVTNNNFIPKGFEQSTLRGLYAFINNDILLFHRLLILNIEPIIKHVATLCEIPTKKSPFDHNKKEKDYWEEDITISKFLENVEIMKTIGSDNAREINVLLFSKHGYRLRSKIAHGLLVDDGFYQSIYIVWFIIVRILYKGI